jgi:hypothetical protein
MYPWQETLSSLSSRTNLRVDALGLVTMLGAADVDASVGRLVPSRYLEYLPLLGAFVLAGNNFTSKRPGFQLANLTSDIITGEVAAWFSRWLLAQDFHQIHHRLVWRVADVDAAQQRGGAFWAAWPIGIALNGILLALAVLAEDWWGFANVVAMILSVVVRAVLVQQNRAGIDNAIRDLKSGPGAYAKMLVFLDDSKVITMWVPVNLVSVVFAGNPKVPRPFYRLVRWVGWVAFAVHVVSIGMASLVTQICTVVLMVVSTVLTVFKVGCDDWRMVERVARVMERLDPNRELSLDSELAVACRISSLLSVTVSEYPLGYQMIADIKDKAGPGRKEQSTSSSNTAVSNTKSAVAQEKRLMFRREQDCNDLELGPGSPKVIESWANKRDKITQGTVRRQDLYVWLNMSNEEEESLRRWNLAPRITQRNESWWALYRTKQERFRERFRGQSCQ